MRAANVSSPQRVRVLERCRAFSRLAAPVGLAILAALLASGCVSPSRFRLRELSPGIYEGCKPTTAAQFEQLRARGIRAILSVQVFTWDIGAEGRQARNHGLIYRNVPILASPLPPSEKQVKQALLLLHDPSLRPIYLHCLLGEDRTTFLLGLYRIYFEDWSPEAAWQEMIRDGFHVRWSLRGFETYFWNHTRKPQWAALNR